MSMSYIKVPPPPEGLANPQNAKYLQNFVARMPMHREEYLFLYWRPKPHSDIQTSSTSLPGKPERRKIEWIKKTSSSTSTNNNHDHSSCPRCNCKLCTHANPYWCNWDQGWRDGTVNGDGMQPGDKDSHTRRNATRLYWLLYGMQDVSCLPVRFVCAVLCRRYIHSASCLCRDFWTTLRENCFWISEAQTALL